MKIVLTIALSAISFITGRNIFVTISTDDGTIKRDEIASVVLFCIFAAFFLLYLVVFPLIIMRLKRLPSFPNQEKTQVRNID
jgi:tellurite resistance protein TehA-like permease